MTLPDLKDITVEYAIRMCGGSHIDNDILIIDEIANMPLPREPRRMQCLLLALCTKGSARYFVDSVEHNVEAGDLIIINQGRVTYDCTMSPDCRGMGIIISYDFFNVGALPLRAQPSSVQSARRRGQLHTPYVDQHEAEDGRSRQPLPSRDDAIDVPHHGLRSEQRDIQRTVARQRAQYACRRNLHKVHIARREELPHYTSRELV